LVVELMAWLLRLLVLSRNLDFVPSLKVYFLLVGVYVLSLLVLLLLYCRISLLLCLVHVCSHSVSFLIA
jgi:hypothetical protein